MTGLPDWFDPAEFHTVVVAFPDVFGRLMGKRLTGKFFRDHVVEDGTHACNYLLTVDVDMNPLPGFALASWDQGYGDFHLCVDPSTMRPAPWEPGCALVLADLAGADGAPIAESPRAMLRRQLEALAGQKLSGRCASELEFYLFHDSYRAAADSGWRDLHPSSDYLIDYHVLQPGRDEDVLCRLRNELCAARVPVEGTKGEWGCGQHEINLEYCEALEAADRHTLVKHAAKLIADQQGRAVTFMAKLGTEQAGSSCHIHFSVWDADGRDNRFATPSEPSPLFRQFLGGLVAYGRELSYFFAPTVNSYKRFQAESWAPTSLVWAHDNRTTGYRVVGHGNGLRIENRMPGADVNPYLAYAATVAAGLRGIEEGLDCGDAYRGNAYADVEVAKLPGSLDEAAALLDRSRLAREAFGDRVIDFYVHTARLEAEAYRREVSDWERARYFERI